MSSSSPPPPAENPSVVVIPRLNPEVAARKSRLMLSLMVSLAGFRHPTTTKQENGASKEEAMDVGGDAPVEAPPAATKGQRARAEVAELVRELLADKVGQSRRSRSSSSKIFSSL